MTPLLIGSVIALSGATSLFAENSSSARVKKEVKKIDVVCVQNAIEKRETALTTALGTLNSSLTSALTARKDALKAAVALPTRTEVAAARKKANSTFTTASKAAHTNMKSVRVSTWNTYKTEAKACGETATEHPIYIERAGTSSL